MKRLEINIYNKYSNVHMGTTYASYREFNNNETVVSNADEINTAVENLANKVGIDVESVYYKTSVIEDKSEPVEHIVCSAIKFKGMVHCGIGCGQIIQNILSFVAEPNHDETKEINNNQGFITSTGRFVDRYEAYPIAKANNQIKYYIEDTIRMEKHSEKPYLMSIHLYKY